MIESNYYVFCFPFSFFFLVYLSALASHYKLSFFNMPQQSYFFLINLGTTLLSPKSVSELCSRQAWLHGSLPNLLRHHLNNIVLAMIGPINIQIKDLSENNPKLKVLTSEWLNNLQMLVFLGTIFDVSKIKINQFYSSDRYAYRFYQTKLNIPIFFYNFF